MPRVLSVARLGGHARRAMNAQLFGLAFKELDEYHSEQGTGYGEGEQVR